MPRTVEGVVAGLDRLLVLLVLGIESERALICRECRRIVALADQSRALAIVPLVHALVCQSL